MKILSSKTNNPSALSSLVFHFQVALCAMAGVTALILAWVGTTGVVAVYHGILGVLLLTGCALLYFKPRVGSAMLVVTVLCLPVMAVFAGFPGWDGATTASRAGSIVGAITAAGILAAPWLEDRGGLLLRYHSVKISEIKPQMDADGR